MQILDDKTFPTTINDKSGPCVIFFTAPWAGPCNLLRPHVEAADSRIGNRVRFFEFVIDDNPDTPAQFGVKGVPLLLSFVDGVPLTMTVGAVPLKDVITLAEDAFSESEK